ncbi:TBC domain-containing protein, partial [archaeon]
MDALERGMSNAAAQASPTAPRLDAPADASTAAGPARAVAGLTLDANGGSSHSTGGDGLAVSPSHEHASPQRSAGAAALDAPAPSPPKTGAGAAGSAGAVPAHASAVVSAEPCIPWSTRCADLRWPDDASTLRVTKFQRCLEARVVDLVALRSLAWSGVPSPYRAYTWLLLLGHVPPVRDRQAATLSKRHAEYHGFVAQYFGSARSGVVKSEAEQSLLRQILVDVPRTHRDVNLFRTDFVQRSLERVLYVWGQRHPAVGYVQGFNEIIAPLYLVCLSPYADAATSSLAHVLPVQLLEAEADIYGCFSRLL